MSLARSTFYAEPQAQLLDEARLVERIQEICAAWPAYGYRRVTAELHAEGRIVNHKKVMRIMKENGLSVRPRRRFIATTDSNHDGPIFPNLARDVSPCGPNTFRLTDDMPEAYAKLKSDFNEALEQLEEAMQNVRASTEAMAAGTQEISSASNDLSRRTEQQACSLEEAASALDEITTTVKKTASSAAHAREVVSAAKVDAEQSGDLVRRAVSAMGEIEKSSEQISQIIAVIDEITFQTNLLALNAGVEAARAGDAGRGFAVVASEVSALAQRSADAAKEIKNLISTSTSQVRQGVDLVAQTGRALERIVTRVREINSLATDIATGANEQSTGLQEVNVAVGEMDKVTQQNAAMAEAATAASVALAKEGDQLASLIHQFNVRGRASAAPLSRPGRSDGDDAHRQAMCPALKDREWPQRVRGRERKSGAARC